MSAGEVRVEQEQVALGNLLDNAIEMFEKGQASHDEPAVKAFYDCEIRAKNPAPAEFRLADLHTQVWADCASAFKLRNAILHSLSRPRIQIELGDKRFAPAWELNLSATDVRVVERAFFAPIAPFTMIARI